MNHLNYTMYNYLFNIYARANYIFPRSYYLLMMLQTIGNIPRTILDHRKICLSMTQKKKKEKKEALSI